MDEGKPRLPPQSPLPSAVRQGGLPLLPTIITYSALGGSVKKTPFALNSPGTAAMPMSVVPSHWTVFSPFSTGSAQSSERTSTPS